MYPSASEIEFCLGALGAGVTFWRVSAWVTRKQIVVENFFGDVRTFMGETATSINRLETNHLAHQEQSLARQEQSIAQIAKHLGVSGDEDVSDAVRE